MDNFVKFALELDVFFVMILWLAFFLLHYILLKNRIYSLLDPLLHFCFFNAFALCLVFNLSISEGNYRYIFDLVAWDFAFFVGFLLYKEKIIWKEIYLSIERVDKRVAHVYFFIVFFVLFISTVILWVARGVPIFSDNPSDAKVLLYTGGFGIVRYIHFVIPPLLVFYAFYNLIKKEGRFFFRSVLWVYLIFSIMISLLSGSKSSLLYLVVVFGFVSILFERSLVSVFDAKVPIKIAIVFSIAAMFLVLVLSGGDALKDLGIRLLASGDVYFFWYSNSADYLMQDFNPVGFLNYIINPLLAMFGVATYNFPLGAIIMNESTGYPLSNFGPNAQLPIVAGFYLFYIKYILAVLFGFLVSYLRVSSYRLLRKYGVLGLSFMVLLFFNATAIFVDINLFLSLMYSSFLIFMPIYILARIVVFSVKKND